MPTQRYKLTIGYRGTHYHGWQVQTTPRTWKGPAPESGQIPTIQGLLNSAMVSVLRHPVTLCGSSRTDAGVHAKGQIAHFDTDQLQIPPEGMRRAINARLPGDILVRAIEPAPPEFDAIRSTLSKRYQYFIWNAEDRPFLFPDLAWHRWQPLDIQAMRTAAAFFVGEHDFASFARPGHGKDSTIRTVLACDVSYRPPRLVVAVEGTGFLWNMVRIIVGTLVEIGTGRLRAGDVPAMMAARDRTAAGPTAPPEGLYLQWIRTGPARAGSSSPSASGLSAHTIASHPRCDTSS